MRNMARIDRDGKKWYRIVVPRDHGREVRLLNIMVVRLDQRVA